MTIPTQSNGIPAPVVLGRQETLNALAASTTDESFDWRAWYLEKRDAFLAAARSWRSIAHTAQIDGDDDVVRMAHKNAVENELWAKDAERKAKFYAA